MTEVISSLPDMLGVLVEVPVEGLVIKADMGHGGFISELDGDSDFIENSSVFNGVKGR